MWYKDLSLRGTKEIVTKGALFNKLLGNFRKAGNAVVIKDLANKAELTEQRIRLFLDGQFEDIPESAMAVLLAGIKMPEEAFSKFAKNTAIPGIGVFSAMPTEKPKTGITIPSAAAQVSELLPATKPVTKPAVATPATKPVTAAQESTKAKQLSFENFVEEAFIIVHEEATGKIEIHPNYPHGYKAKPGQKVILLHNAILFGGKWVPGKGEVK